MSPNFHENMKIDNSRLFVYFLFLQLLCCLAQSSPTRQESFDVLQSNFDKDSTLKCFEDEDCHDLILCRDNKTNCFCNKKSSKCDWKDHTIRPRWRRSVSDLAPSEDDIGPDTCGKDRKVLSNWFLTHGSPNLLEDPIPENVLPTFPNPYDDPNKPPLQPDEVSGYCGMQWQPRQDETGNYTYKLADFDTEEDALAANYSITHRGICGSCSSLQDLGVYMGQNLTTPVRLCGIEGLISDALMEKCLKNLGFSDNCIPIWMDNTKNTSKECRWICLWSWITNEPFNKPDGSLNDCLQCDEDKSGPNFQYYSGRTRRNSGIPSSIHRPPEQVYDMEHCYWYGDV